jgi:TonB-linked SusC/RagA family outer membrane protein
MKTKVKGLLAFLLVFAVQIAFAQTKTVSGLVSDQDGAPLPGATVLVKGTNKGTTSDFDGNFSISAAQGDVLVFSFIGYVTKEVSVGNSSQLNVSLAQDAQALEEVIVTGFGDVSKKSFAGSAKVVAGENVSQKSFTNVSQALAGEVAGVAVFNTSGQPGSTSTVRIRGFGSVSGSQAPLYIVDDAPFGGSLNDINPNDIKSITVLKDASATSLYGARGANGVIVITTKRGKDAGNSINVQVKTGTNYQGVARYETIRSPEEYIGIAWDGVYQRGLRAANATPESAVAYANANLFEIPGGGAVSDLPTIYNMWNVPSLSNGNVDVAALIDPATGTVRPGVTRKYTPESWGDYTFQDANRNEVIMTISNVGENSSVYTSFGFIDDIGYATNTDFSRLNGRVAATHKIKDFIDVNTTLNYTQSESNNNGTGSSSSSQFWWVDNIPTVYPLFRRDADGNKIEDPIYGGYLYDYGLERGRGFGFATNGVADAKINVSRSKANSVNFNNNTTMNITDGVTLENNFAYQYYMNDGISLYEPFYSPAKGQGGLVSRDRAETKNYSIRTGLRFKKQIDEFNISAFLSHVATAYEYNYLSAERSKLVLPDGIDIANGVVNAPGYGYTDNERTESYIANVNTDYQNKYFLTVSYNKDASSRFINNRWGDFYSVGGAWALTEEDFLKDSKFFDFLKVKASYGTIGNSGGIGLYPGYNLYSINNLSDNISLAFTTKGNKDLTWEKSNQFNAGVDFEIGGFFSGSLEAYKKVTNDMFYDRQVGPSVGYASLKVNDGELINEGIEFDFDFKILNKGEFKLSAGINGEKFSNKLMALPIDPVTGEQQKFSVSGVYGNESGRSLFDYYTKEYTGVNPTTGAAEWTAYFEDKNNDGKFNTGDVRINSLTPYINDNPDANIQSEKTDVYANATNKFLNKSIIPDVRGAFRLNASFKNFNLSTLFNYQLGGWAYDSAYATLMGNGYAGTNNFHVDIRNRWRQEGDVTDVPRQDAALQIQQNASSSRFLTRSDFIALNNVRLGYNVPKSLANKLGLDNADLYITGDNLWLASKRKGFNPSTSITGGTGIYTYNPLSTLVFGLNVKL